LAPFGFKVFVNRILIEAGRRLPPTLNYLRDAATPIVSLAYFTALLEEVARAPVTPPTGNTCDRSF
jgi:hypothetical protein